MNTTNAETQRTAELKYENQNAGASSSATQGSLPPTQPVPEHQKTTTTPRLLTYKDFKEAHRAKREWKLAHPKQPLSSRAQVAPAPVENAPTKDGPFFPAVRWCCFSGFGPACAACTMRGVNSHVANPIEQPAPLSGLLARHNAKFTTNKSWILSSEQVPCHSLELTSSSAHDGPVKGPSGLTVKRRKSVQVVTNPKPAAPLLPNFDVQAFSSEGPVLMPRTAAGTARYLWDIHSLGAAHTAWNYDIQCPGDTRPTWRVDERLDDAEPSPKRRAADFRLSASAPAFTPKPQSSGHAKSDSRSPSPIGFWALPDTTEPHDVDWEGPDASQDLCLATFSESIGQGLVTTPGLTLFHSEPDHFATGGVMSTASASDALDDAYDLWLRAQFGPKFSCDLLEHIAEALPSTTIQVWASCFGRRALEPGPVEIFYPRNSELALPAQEARAAIVGHPALSDFYDCDAPCSEERARAIMATIGADFTRKPTAAPPLAPNVIQAAKEILPSGTSSAVASTIANAVHHHPEMSAALGISNATYRDRITHEPLSCEEMRARIAAHPDLQETLVVLMEKLGERACGLDSAWAMLSRIFADKVVSGVTSSVTGAAQGVSASVTTAASDARDRVFEWVTASPAFQTLLDFARTVSQVDGELRMQSLVVDLAYLLYAVCVDWGQLHHALASFLLHNVPLRRIAHTILDFISSVASLLGGWVSDLPEALFGPRSSDQPDEDGDVFRDTDDDPTDGLHVHEGFDYHDELTPEEWDNSPAAAAFPRVLICGPGYIPSEEQQNMEVIQIPTMPADVHVECSSVTASWHAAHQRLAYPEQVATGVSDILTVPVSAFKGVARLVASILRPIGVTPAHLRVLFKDVAILASGLKGMAYIAEIMKWCMSRLLDIAGLPNPFLSTEDVLLKAYRDCLDVLMPIVRKEGQDLSAADCVDFCRGRIMLQTLQVELARYRVPYPIASGHFENLYHISAAGSRMYARLSQLRIHEPVNVFMCGKGGTYKTVCAVALGEKVAAGLRQPGASRIPPAAKYPGDKLCRTREGIPSTVLIHEELMQKGTKEQLERIAKDFLECLALGATNMESSAIENKMSPVDVSTNIITGNAHQFDVSKCPGITPEAFERRIGLACQPISPQHIGICGGVLLEQFMKWCREQNVDVMSDGVTEGYKYTNGTTPLNIPMRGPGHAIVVTLDTLADFVCYQVGVHAATAAELGCDFYKQHFESRTGGRAFLEGKKKPRHLMPTRPIRPLGKFNEVFGPEQAAGPGGFVWFMELSNPVSVAMFASNVIIWCALRVPTGMVCNKLGISPLNMGLSPRGILVTLGFFLVHSNLVLQSQNLTHAIFQKLLPAVDKKGYYRNWVMDANDMDSNHEDTYTLCDLMNGGEATSIRSRRPQNKPDRRPAGRQVAMAAPQPAFSDADVKRVVELSEKHSVFIGAVIPGGDAYGMRGFATVDGYAVTYGHAVTNIADVVSRVSVVKKELDPEAEKPYVVCRDGAGFLSVLDEQDVAFVNVHTLTGRKLDSHLFDDLPPSDDVGGQRVVVVITHLNEEPRVLTGLILPPSRWTGSYTQTRKDGSMWRSRNPRVLFEIDPGCRPVSYGDCGALAWIKNGGQWKIIGYIVSSDGARQAGFRPVSLGLIRDWQAAKRLDGVAASELGPIDPLHPTVNTTHELVGATVANGWRVLAQTGQVLGTPPIHQHAMPTAADVPAPESEYPAVQRAGEYKVNGVTYIMEQDPKLLFLARHLEKPSSLGPLKLVSDGLISQAVFDPVYRVYSIDEVLNGADGCNSVVMSASSGLSPCPRSGYVDVVDGVRFPRQRLLDELADLELQIQQHGRLTIAEAPVLMLKQEFLRISKVLGKQPDLWYLDEDTGAYKYAGDFFAADGPARTRGILCYKFSVICLMMMYCNTWMNVVKKMDFCAIGYNPCSPHDNLEIHAIGEPEEGAVCFGTDFSAMDINFNECAGEALWKFVDTVVGDSNPHARKANQAILGLILSGVFAIDLFGDGSVFVQQVINDCFRATMGTGSLPTSVIQTFMAAVAKRLGYCQLRCERIFTEAPTASAAALCVATAYDSVVNNLIQLLYGDDGKEKAKGWLARALIDVAAYGHPASRSRNLAEFFTNTGGYKCTSFDKEDDISLLVDGAQIEFCGRIHHPDGRAPLPLSTLERLMSVANVRITPEYLRSICTTVLMEATHHSEEVYDRLMRCFARREFAHVVKYNYKAAFYRRVGLRVPPALADIMETLTEIDPFGWASPGRIVFPARDYVLSSTTSADAHVSRARDYTIAAAFLEDGPGHFACAQASLPDQDSRTTRTKDGTVSIAAQPEVTAHFPFDCVVRRGIGNPVYVYTSKSAAAPIVDTTPVAPGTGIGLVINKVNYVRRFVDKAKAGLGVAALYYEWDELVVQHFLTSTIAIGSATSLAAVLQPFFGENNGTDTGIVPYDAGALRAHLPYKTFQNSIECRLPYSETVRPLQYGTDASNTLSAVYADAEFVNCLNSGAGAAVTWTIVTRFWLTNLRFHYVTDVPAREHFAASGNSFMSELLKLMATQMDDGGQTVEQEAKAANPAAIAPPAPAPASSVVDTIIDVVGSIGPLVAGLFLAAPPIEAPPMQVVQTTNEDFRLNKGYVSHTFFQGTGATAEAMPHDPFTDSVSAYMAMKRLYCVQALPLTDVVITPRGLPGVKQFNQQASMLMFDGYSMARTDYWTCQYIDITVDVFFCAMAGMQLQGQLTRGFHVSDLDFGAARFEAVVGATTVATAHLRFDVFEWMRAGYGWDRVALGVMTPQPYDIGDGPRLTLQAVYMDCIVELSLEAHVSVAFVGFRTTGPPATSRLSSEVGVPLGITGSFPSSPADPAREHYACAQPPTQAGNLRGQAAIDFQAGFMPQLKFPTESYDSNQLRIASTQEVIYTTYHELDVSTATYREIEGIKYDKLSRVWKNHGDTDPTPVAYVKNATERGSSILELNLAFAFRPCSGLQMGSGAGIACNAWNLLAVVPRAVDSRVLGLPTNPNGTVVTTIGTNTYGFFNRALNDKALNFLEYNGSFVWSYQLHRAHYTYMKSDVQQYVDVQQVCYVAEAKRLGGYNASVNPSWRNNNVGTWAQMQGCTRLEKPFNAHLNSDGLSWDHMVPWEVDPSSIFATGTLAVGETLTLTCPQADGSNGLPVDTIGEMWMCVKFYVVTKPLVEDAPAPSAADETVLTVAGRQTWGPADGFSLRGRAPTGVSVMTVNDYYGSDHPLPDSTPGPVAADSVDPAPEYAPACPKRQHRARSTCTFSGCKPVPGLPGFMDCG